MTAHDAELFRILSRDASAEERRHDAELIAAHERETLRRLVGRPEDDGKRS